MSVPVFLASRRDRSCRSPSNKAQWLCKSHQLTGALKRNHLKSYSFGERGLVNDNEQKLGLLTQHIVPQTFEGIVTVKHFLALNETSRPGSWTALLG